jgi:single-stranded-DNA-specific exonuclease
LWRILHQDEAEVDALSLALNLGKPAARVLISRGYQTPEAARIFLNPPLDAMHDPFLLGGMRDAAARLALAIRRKEKILLYGDYDVDGTTSVVILKTAIELAGGAAGFHVPDRLKDGYGMRLDVIDRAAAEGVQLIVSVDTGIRASEVVRHASKLSIDVIVTDHHLPEAELPPALAVINPNRADCKYPNKHLCGAGVALKLIEALLITLEWPAQKSRRLIESFLKLAAIATVADVVSLEGENRVIVKHGLEGLREVRNLGLRALMEVAGFTLGELPTAGKVAFRLSPRINAAGRMANATGAIELFLTTDPDRARQLANELHELNKERQEAEAEIVQSILEVCLKTPVTDDQFALVFSAGGWHKGVVGIVASRLVERFHRPAFVISEDSASGEASGSGRSANDFHLLDALESMPDLFTRFGGHKQAAGLTLPVGRVDEFRERLNAFARTRLSAEDFRKTWLVDAVASVPELTEPAVREVLSLAPFGMGNREPLFALLGVEVVGPPSLMGEKHIRVKVRQNGKVLTLKAWNFAERIDEFVPGSRIDAVITVEDDPWSASRGYPGWGAYIKDARKA